MNLCIVRGKNQQSSIINTVKLSLKTMYVFFSFDDCETNFFPLFSGDMFGVRYVRDFAEHEMLLMLVAEYCPQFPLILSYI